MNKYVLIDEDTIRSSLKDMSTENITGVIDELIKNRETIEDMMRIIMFYYCKKEKLISDSTDIEDFGWKYMIRTQLHLVI